MMNQVILYAFLLFLAAPAYTQTPERPAAHKNTVAVLSVNSGAYLEAFSAFQAAYGREVVHYDLSSRKPEIGKDTKLIVTFGGKAANYAYPEGINIVHSLAPGFLMGTLAREAKSVKISFTPDFPLTLSRIKEIQPELKRLRILWASPRYSRFEQEAKDAGARQGIQVSTFKLEGPGSLPDALRSALGETDALWLPPDPLIVTRENLLILREFSWENRIPFYGSTKSITREGAVASFGISFAEMGKAAARAAITLNSGGSLPATVFPDKTEVTLNSAAAGKLGIKFPRSILDEAGYLFP